MSDISVKFNAGGDAMNPDDPDSIMQALRDVAADLAELRAKHIALLAKLDGDTGVNDVDFESTNTPDALLTVAV